MESTPTGRQPCGFDSVTVKIMDRTSVVTDGAPQKAALLTDVDKRALFHVIVMC